MRANFASNIFFFFLFSLFLSSSKVLSFGNRARFNAGGFTSDGCAPTLRTQLQFGEEATGLSFTFTYAAATNGFDLAMGRGARFPDVTLTDGPAAYPSTIYLQDNVNIDTLTLDGTNSFVLVLQGAQIDALVADTSAMGPYVEFWLLCGATIRGGAAGAAYETAFVDPLPNALVGYVDATSQFNSIDATATAAVHNIRLINARRNARHVCAGIQDCEPGTPAAAL